MQYKLVQQSEPTDFEDRIEFACNVGSIEAGSCKEIIRVLVEKEDGTKAIAFLSVRLERGRAKFTLVTKKHRGKETTASAVADWVI